MREVKTVLKEKYVKPDIMVYQVKVENFLLRTSFIGDHDNIGDNNSELQPDDPDEDADYGLD